MSHFAPIILAFITTESLSHGLAASLPFPAFMLVGGTLILALGAGLALAWSTQHAHASSPPDDPNEDIRQSKEMLELFFSQSLDGFFFMTLDEPLRWDETVEKDVVINDLMTRQHVTKVNEAMLKQYGATREAFLGTTPQDLFAHDPEQGRQAFRQLFDAGHLHIDTEERKIDGTPMWIEGDYICMYDAQGRVTGHFGIQRDVTHRREMEKALREAEERWQFALEGAGDGVWDWDVQTGQVHYSRQWKHMLGYDDDEIGTSLEEWSQRVHPDDRAFVLEEINKHLNGQTPIYSSEHRLRGKNGTYQWILDRGKLIHYTNEGQPLRVIGTHTDITQRKQTEEALAKNQQMLFKAQAIANLQSWTADLQMGTFALCTEKDQWMAQASGSYQIDTWMEAIYPADRELWLTAWANAAIDHPIDVEYRMMMENELKWFHTKASVQFNEAGQPASALGVTQDITARKQTEQLLHAQRDLARILSTATTAEAVWPACLAIAFRVCGMDSGGIYLFEAQQRALRLIYHQGLSEEFVQTASYYPEDAPNTRLIQAGKSTFFNAEQIRQMPLSNFEGLKAIAVLPIQHKGQLLGGINLASHTLTHVPEFSRFALEMISAEIGNIIVHFQTEASFRKSEALRSEAQRIGHIGHWEWLAPDQDVFCSDELFKILDIPKMGNLLPRSEFLKMIRTDERARLHQLDKEAFANHADLDYEFSIRLVDGRRRWLHQFAKVTYGEDGQHTRILGIMQDITERKEAEIAMQKNAQILHESQAIANFGTWTADLRAGTFDTTPEGARLIGWAPGIHRVEELLEIIHPEDRDLMQTAWEAAMQGADYDIEHRIIVKGEVRWFHIKAKFTFDAEGHPVSALGITQDITDRRQAEEALRQSEARYRLVSELISDYAYAFRIDAHGQPIFEWVTEGYTRILGYTLDEIMERGGTISVIHPNDLALVQRHIQTILNGQPDTCEYRIISKDGDHHWVRNYARSVWDEAEGRVVQVYGSAQDITEGKQATILQETVYRIAEAAQSAASLQDLYQEIHHRISGVMRAENFYIALYNEARNLLDFVYSVDEKDPIRASVTPGRGLTSHVLKTGTTLFFSSEQELPDVEVMGVPPMIWLGVPLITHGKTIGVMAVQHYSDVQAYTERERRILEFVSTQVATAIHLKRTNDLLQASQAHLEIAQSSAKLGSWELTPQTGTGLSWSKEMFHLFHRDPAEGLPPFSKFLDMIHPNDRQHLLDAQEQAIETGLQVTVEYRTNPQTHVEKYLKATIRPVKDIHGNLIYLAGTVLDITEIKRAFEQLRESEEKYRLLAENISDVIWIMDMETSRFRYVSPSVFQLRGYTVEEVLAQDIAASLTSGSEQYLAQRMPDRLVEFQQGTSKTFIDEIEQPCKDGTTVWTETTTRFLINAENRHLETYGVSRNITERKRAENELRLLEKRYRALIENAPDGIVLVGADGKFKYASPSVERLYGYHSDEVLDLDPSELTHPEERDGVIAMLMDLMANPAQVPTLQYRFRHKNGSWRWIESTFSNLLALPSVEAIAINFSDITERRLAEDALRESNETAQAILNAATESVFLIDVYGKVLACNETTATRLGKQVSDLIGADIYTLLPPEVVEPRKKHVARVCREGKPIIFEDFRLGTWMENSIYPIFDNDGQIRRVAIYGRDITDRKLAENALRESEARAQAMLQAIPDLMFRLDRQGIFLDYKADIKELYDQSGVSLIGKRNRDISPPAFADLIDHFIQTTLETGLLQTFEYVLPIPGQEQQVYEARMTPSGPNEVLAIVRNITERKQAEEALKKSQSRVELALKGANAGMWDWNLQTGETIFNERWAEMIGYTLQELEPISIQTWVSLCHPDDLALSNTRLEKHFAGLTDFYECEARLKHKNGSWVWVVDRGKIMEWDADGKPLRMIGTHLDITESKHVEEALRAREELYRLISTINADYIFSTEVGANGEMILKWVGGGFETITGYTFDEYNARGGWRSTLHPDDLVIDDQNTATLKSNQKLSSELRAYDKHGALHWMQVHANPLWDEAQQRLKGIYGTVQDITARKQAEAALYASEEKYRVLIQSLDNVIATVDAEGRFLYMNDTAAKQLGSTAEQLTGKTMYELFPDEIAAAQMQTIQKAIHSAQTQIYENTTIVQGAPRWYRTSVQPVKDETGTIAHVLINSTDIHNLKTAQQDLLDLNRTLEDRVQQRTAEVQDLYDNAPAGYHSLDANGNIILINQTELQWLGYTREEVLGHPITRFFTPASITTFRENFPGFKQRGWIKNLEFEFIRRDGSIFPVLVNGIATYDEQGNYITSRSTVFDNTERKATDEALRRANLELERAMRLKDEFLANMSHELRTPLNAILAFSEGLLEQYRGPLNERQLTSVHNIETSGRHLLALINDILDLSKVEAGRLELQIQPVALADVCEASLLFVKELASKKALKLAFHLDNHFAIMEADPKRLKQMLVNLLSNAVKFTPVEGQVSLNVATDSETSIVTFTVQDNGVGIAPEDLARLFQPFTQLDSSLSRQHEGTGLGLVLVRRLAELHGGSVTVESVSGQGSQFTVSLPYHFPSLAPTPTAQRPPLRKGVTGPLHATLPTALIVDDAESAAEQLARYLHEIGIQTILHPQGEGAVEKAIHLQPGVILLDLLMPDQSGWEVLAHLKAEPRTRDIPVIIVSVVDERAKGLAAGAAAYLVKPVTREALQQTLRLVTKISEYSAQALVITPRPPSVRILLAEDNEFNIQAMGDYLQDKGYEVILAYNGRQALEMAHQGRPHLILMDIQMPEMDGLEAIQHLRATPDFATIPILALTALAMPGDRERCLAAGANDYLTKPVSLKDLVETIQILLLN